MTIMATTIPLIHLLVWLVVGTACGWLESERLKTPMPQRWINSVIGVAGSVAAGLFFLKWGELVPGNPVLAPFASALVGAGISLSITSPVLRLVARR